MSGTAPTAAPLARLIEAFHRLPGIGPKSAQRLAYHVLRTPREDAESLAAALLEVKDRIQLCSSCQNVTESDPCALCADVTRDANTICVVEEPLDILAIERAGGYNGALPRAPWLAQSDGRRWSRADQGARIARTASVDRDL